ncbi:MAG TPA: PVC-type heme-binding CxxCH protein [Gemmataceae bacterium]|jgi:putative heme-binding domain-containing protein|nr:PVC-type heme-binding CxxCH protein [Gemmataceae bacterium]
MFRSLLASIAVLGLLQSADAQTKKDVIPHAQSRMPGPPLTPAESLKHFKVPPGFAVELVASEPDIVNPVAMCIDEKGRFWITESIEYPRRSPGPGKDRVKLLEIDALGKAKVRTVIEGLNIPSGINVGHGGVWICNSPDILYYPFEDFEAAKVGKPQVVVTGFGRFDTHELPNSLTWGPDGWLYGLNGVFNPAVVKQNGKTFEFTCAMFRIHPRTKEFQVWCEGTSNPWGIAFNENGDAFVSACVIDHLWHLVETGYYQRQGGPYPAFTWPMGSIVKHKHQQAAYCGLLWFDSDAYPEEYRGKLYMGNVHGNCINSDELTRDGSTYFAKPRPDFLNTDDAWFMPVVQKVGPNGCMYVLDWYDRYHCYQDANRDPAGIDRLSGRLYRISYKGTPRAGRIDLFTASDDTLIELLSNSNVFLRETAQRKLSEKLQAINTTGSDDLKALEKKLRGTFLGAASKKARAHALWALIGGGYTTEELITALLNHQDPEMRAWGVRHMAPFRGGPTPKYTAIASRLAHDISPDVRLQVAIGAGKFEDANAAEVLLDVLAHSPGDKLIPHVVWQNLHPLLEDHSDDFLKALAKIDLEKAPAVVEMMPRIIDRLLGAKTPNAAAVVTLIGDLSKPGGNQAACGMVVASIAKRIQNGELKGESLKRMEADLMPILRKNIDAKRQPELAGEVVFLGATFRDADDVSLAQIILRNSASQGERLKALDALIYAEGPKVLDDLGNVWKQPGFAAKVLASLGRIDSPKVADVVLKQYPTMAADVQPKAIELLTQRSAWSKQLLGEIDAKKIPTSALNVNQVRKLLASKDAQLVKRVTSVWGTVRDGRNPEREKVVADMRALLKKTPGDVTHGQAIFKKICAQCHKLHGEGADVGPDITSNGRNDYEQLLSNVFDPSLVIGAGFRATRVVTTSGKIVDGLLAEDSPNRVVLKTQGGKLETIPRAEVDDMKTSKLSYMPEGLEKQMTPQEIADLFAVITLDRPAGDPRARKIPGAP